MTKLEIKQIREDFPILKEQVNGRQLVYLDNAATTQKPSCVINALTEAYEKRNANIHRGVHTLSIEATQAHEAARETIARFINARSSKEVIFTSGTTEGINLLAHSFCAQFCTPGDEIIVTTLEHHSNIVPWQLAAKRGGLNLKVAPINQAGEVQINQLKALVTERTKLIAIAHVSNVLGTINPIEEIISYAHERGVYVSIDGAQAISHLKVDVQALDADFYLFSGHKIYGPTGIGVLYGKEELLNAMPPFLGGGEMIQSVTFEETTFNELPFKFEAGTPNYVDSVGLAKAINYVEKWGIEEIAAYEQELLIYATEQLLKIEDMRIIGTAKNKCSVISFLVGNIHPLDLGMLLDKQGIAVRTGHHCAQPLIDWLNIPGTARASFAFYNTKEEIDLFIEALKKAIMILK